MAGRPAAGNLRLASNTTTLAANVQNMLTGQAVAIAKLGDVLADLAVNLTIAVLIFVVALWLSGWAAKLTREAIHRIPKTHSDETLADFASSFVRYVVVVIGVIAVLRRLGVETTSIIAVLGAASLAIGLALQGALTNVAAGVMILLFRPYRVGDQVLIAGKTGTVRRLDLFNTEIRAFDNLKIVVPNGKAFGDVVVNYTAIGRRRIEITVGVGYDDDLDKALATAIACAAADPRILKDPAPWAKVTELAPSTVNITLRCWTSPNGFWDVRYDLLKTVKETFDKEGISLPFPTQVSLNAPASGSAPDDAGNQGAPSR